MIGVHTPEYPFEKDLGRIKRFAAKFKVTHPILVDNDYAYWKAIGNEYWPQWYLIGRSGHIRGKAVGEMHAGSRRAKQFAALLDGLLDETVESAQAAVAAAQDEG